MSTDVALLFTNEHVHLAGLQQVMLKLAWGLAERGLRVDLLMYMRYEGTYHEYIHPAVRLVELRAARALATLPALVRYLRRARPAVLLAAGEHMNIVTVWARLLSFSGARVYTSTHSTLTHSLANAPNRHLGVNLFFARYFYPLADGIIAVSEGAADDMAQVTGIPRARIQVVYNAALPSDLGEKVQEPLDHPWFVPDAPPVLLGVGRLSHAKDFPTLIRAFALLRAQRPARLLILGEGEDRAALEGLVRELGLGEDVALPGFVSNPFAYMARAAAFVLSSRWEGLPTVLIEALGCGLPVVATDCLSGPAEILGGGRFGALVPVEDPEALAEAIAATLDAPLASALLKERAALFSMERAVDRYLEVLGLRV